MSQGPGSGTPKSQTAARLASAGFTPRAWILLAILVPAVCYCVYLAEMVYFAADLVSSSLMVGAVFPLCLLLILNRFLASRSQKPLIAAAFASVVLIAAGVAGSPGWAAIVILAPPVAWFAYLWKRSDRGPVWKPLSREELLVVYTGLTVSIWFCTMGGVQFLVSSMESPFFFASSSNGWSDLWPLIPRWLAVRDPSVVDPFFNGHTDWTRPAILHAWATPILTWSFFILCFFGFALSLNALLRKQWIDHERLTFPIAQIPLLVTAEGAANPLWSSPMFWLGAGIAFGLEAINGVHQVLPTVPSIPLLPTELNVFFTQKPWSGIGSIPAAFYPWVIGLVYLVPLDVSFSSWFFFVIARLEAVAAVAMGFRAVGAADIDAVPYQMDQGFGAFLGLALLALWAARGHLSSQLECALRGRSGDAARLEARSAFGCLLFCGAALLIWFRLIAGSFLVMAIWMVVYILVIIAASRMRAEAGPGWIVAPRWPQDILSFSIGGGALSHSELAAITSHTWLAQDIRHTPMATQMEGFKIGESAGIPAGPLAISMVAAMILALAGSWWAALSVTYRFGYATAHMHQWRLHQGLDIWGWLQSWISGAPMKPNHGIVAAWVVGCAIVIGLSRLRQVFLWWPLHPVGYALANSFSMTWLWLPTLIAWAVKALVLRYGGSTGYRKGIPFAIGLILGDFFISGLFAIISALTGVPMYKTFPVP